MCGVRVEHYTCIPHKMSWVRILGQRNMWQGPLQLVLSTREHQYDFQEAVIDSSYYT